MAVGRESLYKQEEYISYRKIREYVRETTGLKPSNLDVAQIKEKCGLLVRGEHKPDKARCSPAREAAIMDAFRHFGIMQDEEG